MSIHASIPRNWQYKLFSPTDKYNKHKLIFRILVSGYFNKRNKYFHHYKYMSLCTSVNDATIPNKIFIRNDKYLQFLVIYLINAGVKIRIYIKH